MEVIAVLIIALWLWGIESKLKDGLADIAAAIRERNCEASDA